MGNYMETCIQREETEEKKLQQQQEQEQQQEKQESWKEGGTLGKESSTMRVKLVLTKDELEWLLFQLKNKERKLEEVLGEIEKSRLTGKSVTVWKPSLESIMESPEIHHEMDRSA